MVDQVTNQNLSMTKMWALVKFIEVIHSPLGIKHKTTTSSNALHMMAMKSFSYQKKTKVPQVKCVTSPKRCNTMHSPLLPMQEQYDIVAPTNFQLLFNWKLFNILKLCQLVWNLLLIGCILIFWNCKQQNIFNSPNNKSSSIRTKPQKLQKCYGHFVHQNSWALIKWSNNGIVFPLMTRILKFLIWILNLKHNMWMGPIYKFLTIFYQKKFQNVEQKLANHYQLVTSFIPPWKAYDRCNVQSPLLLCTYIIHPNT